ncbi:MAG: hypothetical protein AB1898_04400 [Acidobacteriota bacterium]
MNDRCTGYRPNRKLVHRVRCRRNVALTVLVLALLIGPFVRVLGAEDPELTRQEIWKQKRIEKSKNLHQDRRSGLENAMLYIQREKILQRLSAGWNGWHPKLGGLSTGSGFAGGLRYAPSLARGNVVFETSGAISTRTYQFYDLKLGAPRLVNGRLFTEFYSRYRSYPQEDFFGLGPNSRRSDRTSYALEDSLFEFTMGVNWTRWLATGFRQGYIKNNVGRGTDRRFRSTEQVFASSEVPGLDRQTDFYRTQAFAQVDYRDEPGNAHAGGFYGVTFSYYDDRNLDLHTFRRIDAEVQQYFPFFQKKRVIAFRARTSLADVSPSQSVPFYMMDVLGGSETLRGFREFRFRDQNLLLLNLEYRWEAFSGLDMAIFGDAGKVTRRRSDIDFKDLKTDVGFGFRFNTIKSVFLRIDVGFGNEGKRIFFKFGPAF